MTTSTYGIVQSCSVAIPPERRMGSEYVLAESTYQSLASSLSAYAAESADLLSETIGERISNEGRETTAPKQRKVSK